MAKRDGWKIVILLAAVCQLLTTEVHWVWMPTDNQRQTMIIRPGLYPWGGYKLEVSSLAITYSNWRKNIWENINLNQYFFGGHPIERGVDFPKFPFFLLPFALVGILQRMKDEWFWQMSLCTLVGLIIFGAIGNSSSFGPVVTYPFWVAAILSGLRYVVKKS